MALEAGTKLGLFEIISPLGAGGMGEVYRAKDTSLCREIAIKILPDNIASTTERLQRFEREAQIIAALNHPNIVTIHGIHNENDHRFIAMELVEGKTLDRMIAIGGMSSSRIIDIGTQLSKALAAAHDNGIIHRDLKPANIMVTEEGHIKVLDFGLAKVMADQVCEHDTNTSATQSISLTQSGAIIGTPAYMSPEQVRAISIDQQVDVWAFGCILFECLTARRAFGGADPTTCLHSILYEEPNWSLLPSDTPDRIRLVLKRCLVKDKSKRQRDLGDVALELDEIKSPTRQDKLIDGDTEDIIRERSAFQFIVNSLFASGNLLVDPPIQAAQLESMSDVHQTCQYILDRYVSPRLLEDDVAYFAYKIKQSIPLTDDEITQFPSFASLENKAWVYQIAICNRERGNCRPGLKMHNRSNIARVYVSGNADPYAHDAAAKHDECTQPLVGERVFRAFPVKIVGHSIGVVGLSAGSDSSDLLSRFRREGINLSLILGLIFEIFSRRTMGGTQENLVNCTRTAIAEFYDGLLPTSQVAQFD